MKVNTWRNVADKLSNHEIRKLKRQEHEANTLWLYENLDWDDARIITVTVAKMTGFDGKEFIPKKENLINKVEKMLHSFEDDAPIVASSQMMLIHEPQYSFWFEDSFNRMGGEGWENPHAHGITDLGTAGKIAKYWVSKGYGFIKHTPIDQPLMACRYITKDGTPLPTAHKFRGDRKK